MPFGVAFAHDLAALIFQGTAIANIADNAASSPATTLYLALHTGDPSAGDQTTNETTYPSYARVAINRASSSLSLDATYGTVTLVSTAVFPTCSGASGETLTHFSIGLASTGAGKILACGAVSPTFVIDSGQHPELGTGTTAALV